MSLKEPLPQPIEAGLDRLLKSSETIQFTVAADIDSQGKFRNSWLVATDQRIMVVHQTLEDRAAAGQSDLEVVMEVPLSRVGEVKTRDFVGNGSLSVEVKQDGKEEEPQVIEAVRFSRSLADKFADVSDALGELARQSSDSPDIAPEEDEAESRNNRKSRARCPKCDRPFKHNQDFCPYCLDKRAVLSRLMVYLKPYWWQAIIALVITVVGTELQLLPPYLLKLLTDDVLIPKHHEMLAARLNVLWLICWAYAGRWVVGALLGGVRMQMMAWLGQHIIYDVRTHLYRHIQELSVSYFDKRHVGAVMSRVMNDTSVINDFLVNGVQNFLVNIITLVSIAVIMFFYDWKLTLLVMAPTPFIMLLSRWFSLRIRPIYRRNWRNVSSMNSVLASTITGIRVVKSFAQEEREINRFNSRAQDYYDTNIASNNIRVIYGPALTVLNGFGALIIWIVGGWQVVHGQMGAGTVMMFTGYIWQFYGPLQQLTDLNDQVQNVATASERVFQTLDTQSDVQDQPEAVTAALHGRVEFKNVLFGYEDNDGAAPVLQDISFVAEPGQLIGLVGHSGSGKTTLVNLLLRFYDVTEGEIKIDGVDIRDMDSRVLREQIGMVLQEPFLFSGTVSDNIAYGRPDATTDEIIDAAKAANAHKFIMNFTDAYDTEVGERGVKLSGGEKQRISIARAILNNPRILILDEATSAVDTETEALIQEAMERLMKGRTTFAIAHRLSTLRNADKLIVMDHGKIAETGTHEELMELEDGVYGKLVRIQTELSKTHVL